MYLYDTRPTHPNIGLGPEPTIPAVTGSEPQVDPHPRICPTRRPCRHSPAWYFRNCRDGAMAVGRFLSVSSFSSQRPRRKNHGERAQADIGHDVRGLEVVTWLVVENPEPTHQRLREAAGHSQNAGQSATITA